MFQNELLKSDGQKFQDSFVKFMQKSSKDFRPVKPHGNIGTRKNDEFDEGCETTYECCKTEYSYN